jgi:hypothetical protein
MPVLENHAAGNKSQAMPAYQRWLARGIAAVMLIALAGVAMLSAFFVITVLLFAIVAYLLFGPLFRARLRRWAQAKADALNARTHGAAPPHSPADAHDTESTQPRRRAPVVIEGKAISE